jgi:hypothetical protein
MVWQFVPPAKLNLVVRLAGAAQGRAAQGRAAQGRAAQGRAAQGRAAQRRAAQRRAAQGRALLLATAFGVFLRFEVTNFDVFLCLFRHISTFLFWVVGCFCCLDCVSDAEQQLTAAGDVLFGDQIIEADQFFLSGLGAGMLWISAVCIFFVFRCTHFGLPITSNRASLILDPDALQTCWLTKKNLRIADLLIA